MWVSFDKFNGGDGELFDLWVEGHVELTAPVTRRLINAQRRGTKWYYHGVKGVQEINPQTIKFFKPALNPNEAIEERTRHLGLLAEELIARRNLNVEALGEGTYSNAMRFLYSFEDLTTIPPTSIGKNDQYSVEFDFSNYYVEVSVDSINIVLPEPADASTESTPE